MGTGVPTTVTAALAGRPVVGRRCLDAGTGFGNAAAGLSAANAERVVSVTTDPRHAYHAADRFAEDDRIEVMRADLRAIPLPDAAVDFIIAHAVCNALTPRALAAVAAEWRRIAAPGCVLVVDDYDPLPDEAAVSPLFDLENAAAILATGQSAQTFYPAALLANSFAGAGWKRLGERTLLEPVPWTRAHLDAHVRATERRLGTLSASIRRPMRNRLADVAGDLAPTTTGRMYSVALRFPGPEDVTRSGCPR